jgi:hypothetical protein
MLPHSSGLVFEDQHRRTIHLSKNEEPLQVLAFERSPAMVPSLERSNAQIDRILKGDAKEPRLKV